MELTSRKQKLRSSQFYNCYLPVYTTGTHATEFDGETLPSLHDKIGEKALKKKSVRMLAQAIHNIYAKKLGIAPVKVLKVNDPDLFAAFSVRAFSTSNNRSVIIYSDNTLFGGPTTLFNSIIHETKHAQQAYNIHNFLKFNVLPKSDKEKLLLLAEFFLEYRFTASKKLPYYFMFNEIDAYFYEFQEMKKLNERYPEKFNGYTYYDNLWDKLSTYLYDFDYQKNGLNCKGLKQVYKAIKTDIFCSLRGDYGQDMKSLCTQVQMSGFNLDKAFDSFIEELDYLHDYSVLLSYKIRDMGLKAKFEKNGNLIYHKTRVSHFNRNCISANIEKAFFNLSNDGDDKYIWYK